MDMEPPVTDDLNSPASIPGPNPRSGRGFVLLQRLLPQHLLSRLALRLTRSRVTWWKRWQIDWFIRRYQVDMSVAQTTDPQTHPHFNAFFTRALKPGARPLAAGEDTIVSPVDGTVSQAGIADRDRLLQAKGHTYTIDALLGGDEDLATAFYDGPFTTAYLAPRDYHRVHMPLAGRLRMMRYVPGSLFSVNDTTTHLVPGLFARNERLVSLFDTAAGPMAVVMVGAMLVSAMETVWSDGVIHARPGRRPRTWRYEGERGRILQRGEEMGRFNMGSTVIVLFGRGRAAWSDHVAAGKTLRMGEMIGKTSPLD